MHSVSGLSKRQLAIGLLAVCSGLLPRLALAAEATAAKPIDPCALLDGAEVRAIQGHEVVERIASSSDSGSFQVLQCVYRTADLVHSVSLALSLPDGRDDEAGAARAYWVERFHGESAMEEEEAEAGTGEGRPAVPVSGLGEESFWVGDGRAGALYVLLGERFLRLSVGGVPDPAERRDRTLDLARSALSRAGARPPAASPHPLGAERDGPINGPATAGNVARERR